MTRLEFGEISAAGKTDADAMYATYHHHSPQQECCKSKALAHVSVFDPVLQDNPVSTESYFKKCNKTAWRSTSHATGEDNKRWAIQSVFQENARTTNNCNFLISQDEETEMLTQSRIQARYNGSDREYVNSSDSGNPSDNENSKAVTLSLNCLYRTLCSPPIFIDHKTYVPCQYTEIFPQVKAS